MPDKTKPNFWLDLISQFMELFLKSSNKRKRTYHQHVVPYEDRWAVRREGTKYKADVIIHRQDGTIRDRINYD